MIYLWMPDSGDSVFAAFKCMWSALSTLANKIRKKKHFLNLTVQPCSYKVELRRSFSFEGIYTSFDTVLFFRAIQSAARNRVSCIRTKPGAFYQKEVAGCSATARRTSACRVCDRTVCVPWALRRTAKRRRVEKEETRKAGTAETATQVVAVGSSGWKNLTGEEPTVSDPLYMDSAGQPVQQRRMQSTR